MKIFFKKIYKQLLKSEKSKKFWLKKFITLNNFSYEQISRLVVGLEKGVHPKHRIMNYHKFFVDNIESQDTILDLGCGNGFLAYDLAQKAKKVVGIDISQKNINFAKSNYQRDNLEFLVGDATTYNFTESFDKIALSNVLEHIQNRVDFLSRLKEISNIILIRVPLINRDWLTVYKKEKNFEYRLDKTHYIEFTLEGLQFELKQAGWDLVKYSINFGEIWGIVKKYEKEN